MSGVARFDAEAIRSLAALLLETGLTEIEVAEGDSRIRVVRTLPQAVHKVAAADGAVSAAINQAPPAPSVVEADETPEGAVVSPMVGVVYLSPEPGSAPFVTLGQSVSAGQTLLLIEAMKTFNQIKSPRSGTVTRVLVASGTPVEYGEPLIVVA